MVAPWGEPMGIEPALLRDMAGCHDQLVKIAIGQCCPGTADPGGNLTRLDDFAGRAAAAGADILICPEMMLTGYRIGAERVRALAEAADGPSAQRIAELAVAHGIAIVYGYPERVGDTLFNSAQLIDSTGTSRLNYRKVHLFGAAEQAVFTPGTVLSSVVEIDAWRIGLLICYDVEFPEAVRMLALAKADLVLVPTALMQPYANLPDVLLPARAYENQVYLAYANFCGAEGDLDYCGTSLIAGPDGAKLARAEAEEALISAELSAERLAASRRINTYLADRRPALYAALTAPVNDP